ncbi:hypothetical protein GCG21_00565 [Pseudactinotalea sp. HY160]|uniref:hypothetical protein n=1 Tax=Pseudactinotalea sp. HY160 TaxID=2654490 RepID=UPI00128DDFAE|nr:hypothetical protein [Pseudactinotalea sp. HY160]MPV48525.1 hypothetical protein [Pseudactinotalea sp. HY160]
MRTGAPGHSRPTQPNRPNRPTRPTRPTRLYRLYGLVIDSEIDLHQDRPATGRADLTVRIGAAMTATTAPPIGRRLLHLETAESVLATATTTGSGYHLRFYGTCDVEIDRALTTVVTHAVTGADPDTVAVLVSGTVLSFVLAMRREPVLHASAVEVEAGAVAFVGGSGMGKSTMATLLCAAGGRLVTDDVLRVDLRGARPRCYLGGTALRLRKSAAELSALFDTRPARRVTGDGRDALTMAPAVRELLPLAAIVIPVPRHDAPGSRPELVRLDPARALLALLRFPRIVGWEDPDTLDRQLQELGAIVEAVPVHVAGLPWGPPFPDSLAADVLEGVRGEAEPRAGSSAGPPGAARPSARGNSSPDVAGR